ncbi:MAG: hypothetical protein ACLQJL_06795 [Roseiarcus sp.]
MELRRKFNDSSDAAVNYIQVSHRREAVDYTIAGIRKIHDLNLELLGRDPLTSEMEGFMQAWVVETLLQGAYMREYHLWEKDCKAYFRTMASRNGGAVTMKSGRFTDHIRDILGLFSVVLPPGIFDAIERMRARVNVMKHEAGLETEHFITEADYTAAIEALEGFWNHLATAEQIVS